jgi:hypothetical protein
MRVKWTPTDYAVLIITGTVCLCLLILVGGAVAGVLTNRISKDALGQISGVGIGGGLLGFGVILHQIIRVALLRR